MKKILVTRLSTKEKENALNEIRILASINHPNIISYKEAFYDNEKHSLYIIMEYADNKDLEYKINEKYKTKTFFIENEIIATFKKIVYGLKALHDLKIIHRDLKLANIFLFKNGDVKMGDLNVSKVLKKGLLNTQTGTPYYASPEIWNNKPYDFKSDIWSLGCLLYEMITFNPPFKGSDMKEVFELVNKGKIVH